MFGSYDDVFAIFEEDDAVRSVVFVEVDGVCYGFVFDIDY